MKRVTGVAAVVIMVVCCAPVAGRAQAARAEPTPARHFGAASQRALPGPLFGVTVDDIANASDIVASSENLPDMPTTRIYFDVKEPASYYVSAVSALHPVSYLMGELLDSSDETSISTSAYNTRVKSYLSALGGQIDVWEIGNEVNGDWTGRYPTVSAKLTEAYDDVSAAGYRSALTLYYNVGCGDGSAELSPVAFSRKYVPAAVRDGLTYVLLSYYEDDCQNIRPSAATWTAYFQELHILYPDALLGFGEIGMNKPATASTLPAAKSLIGYYYGLHVGLPYYVGGYFWWYYDEDCLPYASKPLWPVLQAGFQREAAAISPVERVSR
jgi:hypothetical protein